MNTIFLFVFNSVLLGVSLSMDAFSLSVADGLNISKKSVRMRVAIPLTFASFQFLMPMAGWFCVRSLALFFSDFQHVIPWIALVLLLFIGGKMVIEGIREIRSKSDDLNSEGLEVKAERSGSESLSDGLNDEIPVLETLESGSGSVSERLNIDNLNLEALENKSVYISKNFNSENDNLKVQENENVKKSNTKAENTKKEGLSLKYGALLLQGVATSIDALSVGVTIAEYNLLQALTSCFIIGGVTFAICSFGLSVGKRIGAGFSEKASVFGGVILILVGIEIFIKGVL